MIFRWRHSVIQTLLLGVLCLSAVVPHSARAQDAWEAGCEILRSSEALPTARADVLRLQTGLRAALRMTMDQDRLEISDLRDGGMGKVTREALTALCAEVPLTPGNDPVEGTVELASHYAAITAGEPESPDTPAQWPQRARTMDLAAQSASLGPVAIRMAGGADMALAALRPDLVSDPNRCSVFAPGGTPPDILDPGAVSVAMRALGVADAGLSSQSTWLGDIGAQLGVVCAAYPVPGPAGQLIASLTRLGRLEVVRPGLLSQLADPEFVTWVAADQGMRLRRLLGTDPAVLTLAADHAATRAPVSPATGQPVVEETAAMTPAATSQLPPSCTGGRSGLKITYTSLTPEDLTRLNGDNAALVALEPLAESTFPSAAALRDAILIALDGMLDACLKDRIAKMVTAPGSAGKFFSIDPGLPDTVEFQKFSPHLVASMTEKLQVRSPTADQLTEVIVADMELLLKEDLDATISEIAGAVSEAAEERLPTLDTPAEGAPEGDLYDNLFAFEVPVDTLEQIFPEAQDADFSDALIAADFEQFTSRELVKTNVTTVLVGVRDARVEAATELADLIVPDTLREFWSLTPALIDGIAALPTLAPPTADISGDLTEIVGLSYPNDRLFEVALKNFSEIRIDRGEDPLDARSTAALLDVARKTVDNPRADRVPVLLTDDCGCVAPRRENALVYGFWPFWEAPLENTDNPVEPGSSAGLNLEIVERVAFWGLQTTVAGVVVPEERWTNEAARSFITSAHRHQAKADLAVELVGWQQWDSPTVDRLVVQIDRMMRPLERLDRNSWRERLRSLPAIFDSKQPDGLTLYLRGYDGRSSAPRANLEPIEQLVTQLNSRLELRDQTINLAVDQPLSDDSNIQLFGDLAPFLTGLNPEDRLIKLLLVFLERPTTATKKAIRRGIDSEAAYGGELRTQIYRALVPVVPPGAHSAIYTSRDQNSPEPTEYGQLVDDLIWFQDNFAGIGLWPGTGLMKNSDTGVAAEISKIFDKPRFAAIPEQYRSSLETLCDTACPNRVYVQALSAISAVAAAFLMVASLFNGLANKVSYGLMLVPMTIAVLFGLLGLLATCDTRALWPLLALVALAIAVSGILLFNAYQRGLNGPKP